MGNWNSLHCITRISAPAAYTKVSFSLPPLYYWLFQFTPAGNAQFTSIQCEISVYPKRMFRFTPMIERFSSYHTGISVYLDKREFQFTPVRKRILVYPEEKDNFSLPRWERIWVYPVEKGNFSLPQWERISVYPNGYFSWLYSDEIRGRISVYRCKIVSSFVP